MNVLLSITIDDDLILAIDERVGTRGRSAFVSECVRSALANDRRRRRREMDDIWAPERAEWAAAVFGRA